jgi:PAS domain S-box-containing protein
MPDLGLLLLERSPGAVLVLNRDGQVLTVNREALRMLSAEAERLVGRPVLAVVAPDDRDRVREVFLRVLAGQEREWISRFVRGDGATRVQWVRAVPVEEEGRVGRIVMFTRDVTESQSGRPDVRQLQTILENLPGQFVAVVDTGGLVRYASGLSRTHFRDDVEVLGLPYEQLLEVGEENHLLCSQMLLELLEGKDWGGTHWHARADGGAFPVTTLASPYRDPRTGRVLGGLVVGRDVAAERRWRLRAEQSERLAEVGRLVAGIAVRLRDAAADGALERISVLAEAVERLAGVSWSSTLEWVSLPHEVERLTTEVAPVLQARATHLHVEVADGLPPLHGYGAQVRELLRVLLANALEAAPPDGSAAVTVACSLTPDAERLRLHVADRGAGIPEEDLHRVMDPFYSTKVGHAGLGLTVARAIVAGHGGTLTVESPGKGGGTTVTAEIPREAPGTTMRFRPVPLALRAARSVLIVDDELAVRLSVRRFLERVGYEVREAWSGRSALAQITAGTPPELVITDLRMGDGSGAWLMEELARDFPDLLRRTVILTGAGEDDELSTLTRLTGCPLLRKPLEMAQLLDVLDEVASRD